MVKLLRGSPGQLPQQRRRTLAADDRWRRSSEHFLVLL